MNCFGSGVTYTMLQTHDSSLVDRAEPATAQKLDVHLLPYSR